MVTAMIPGGGVALYIYPSGSGSAHITKVAALTTRRIYSHAWNILGNTPQTIGSGALGINFPFEVRYEI